AIWGDDAISGSTAFTLLAPLFGGIFRCRDRVGTGWGMTVLFVLALDCAGIYLVNRSPKTKSSK
ncbi:MAG: hypothetical protein R6U27_11705, partial [Desulfobacterales bacterium]